MKASDIPSLEQLIADIDRETMRSEEAIDEKSPHSSHSSLLISKAYTRTQYIRFYLADMLIAIPLSSALIS